MNTIARFDISFTITCAIARFKIFYIKFHNQSHISAKIPVLDRIAIQSL